MVIRLLNPGEGALAARLASLAPGAANWPAHEYERVAADRSGSAFCLVAEEPAGEIAGFLAATLAAGEAEVQNLAVAPEKRRRGLASSLLTAALERLSAAGAQSVWLEVRESNQEAIAFYERHGFRRAGRRPGYYSCPPEAALILALQTP
jgi:ribosomal-protein-alanine N-acetyltransferase